MAETYGAQLHFANANRIGVQRIRPYQRLVTQTYRIRYIISVFTLSGFALAGNPYMGIGRNMAYRKELFFKQKECMHDIFIGLDINVRECG